MKSMMMGTDGGAIGEIYGGGYEGETTTMGNAKGDGIK
jgi:hypothetical protein